MLTTNTLKGIAVATALSVGALTLATPAEAGRRNRNLAAGALLGLGAAAIIAGSHRRNHYYDYGYSPGYYAPPPQPYYYAPSPQAYYGPTTYRSYAPAPWTPAWYRYCQHKYRSFHAPSGTYQPYHGPRQICR
jgi:hypothetical protein